MDHFKLVSEYAPTGDQPQAIAELVEGFREGNQFETLLGVTGSGKTFTMANVIQALNKPTLIIAHNKTLAAQLYGEMKRFVARRENFQLSVETKKRFKQDFETRVDEAYRRRGRRVWLKVVSYAAMLALPIIAGMLLWTRQSVEEVVDYGIGPIEHGVRKATLVLNDGKVLALDTSRMTLKEIDGVTIHTNDQALVYVDSLDDQDVNLQNRLITPKGGEYTIMLADGTKVWVNAATEIRYPVKFAGKERRVRLEGEAYFEVVKNTEKPFIVEANGMEVKVYGTQFNVNSRRDDQIQTTLVEGSVSVKPKGLAEVMLKPNQQAVFNKLAGRVTVRDVDVLSYVAWQRGNYYFENKSIGEILDELSLWYDIQVFFVNNEVRNERFSGYLPRYEEINGLLSLIEKTSHVQFEIKGRVIIVRK